MVLEQDVREDEDRRRRDSGSGLNWQGASKEQRKPLLFNEKQPAVNEYDELN